MKYFITATLILCTYFTFAQTNEPETFEYTQADSTITMQKYFLVFLKKGPVRNQSEEEEKEIQKAHRAYLGKLYTDGFTSLTGPSEE